MDVVIGGGTWVVAVLLTVEVVVVAVVVVVMETGLGGTALDEGYTFRLPPGLGFLTVVLRGVTSFSPGIAVPFPRVPTLLWRCGARFPELPSTAPAPLLLLLWLEYVPD